ncbi:MAG: hypothetical protein MJZ64_06095 [Paludibacteraceae bacterium]|nr:hypothetical protein [Paludibacteraceae bacterium]
MKKTLISLIALALSASAMAVVIPNVVGIQFVSKSNTLAQSYWYEASDADDTKPQTGKDVSLLDMPSGGGASATEVYIYCEKPYGASFKDMASLYTTKLAGKYVSIKANTTDTEYKFVFNTCYSPSKDIWFVDWVEEKSFKIEQGLEYPFSVAKGATLTKRFQFLESEAVFSHDREVASGNWGTICYPELIDSVQGAVVYEIAGRNADATQIAVVPVAVADMVKGKPYLFNATAAAQKFFYNPEETVADTVAGANGLMGLFEDGTLGTDGYYVVKGQSFIPSLGTSTVLANRAYLAMTDITQMHIYQETAGVAARFFSVGRGTVTGDEQVAAGMADGTYMIDGQFMIVKDGKTTNVLGFGL